MDLIGCVVTVVAAYFASLLVGPAPMRLLPSGDVDENGAFADLHLRHLVILVAAFIVILGMGVALPDIIMAL